MSTPTPQRSAREQFDRQANHYDEQWNQWSRESINWMLEYGQPAAGERVLDVATGTGFTALAFAPHVGEVVGLDVSPGMLQEARQRTAKAGAGNVTFQEGPAEELPFADGSFHLVTCRIAAHHFLDVERFVRETARVLRPEGRFVLADTTVPGDDETAATWQNRIEEVRDPSHVRNYSLEEWRNMVSGAGLQVTAGTVNGGGITIPVSDWVRKAGCTPEQTAQVYQMLKTAPECAMRQFRVVVEPEESFVTWQRVALVARKPASGAPRG